MKTVGRHFHAHLRAQNMPFKLLVGKFWSKSTLASRKFQSILKFKHEKNVNGV